MSKNNLPNPTSLANNLVHTGTGNINYSNYVEPVGHTPCDDLQINNRNDGDYIPLPHQDPPDESTDSESNTSYVSTNSKQSQPVLKTKISLKESNQTHTTGLYQVPLSLRKQFKIPYKANAPVVTPNSKAIPFSVLAKPVEHPSHDANHKEKTQAPNATKGIRHTTNDIDYLSLKQPARTLPLMSDKLKHKDHRAKDSSEDSNTDNLEEATQRFFPNRELFEIYDSPYLNKMFKPTFDSLNLADELEPLAPLLMSQDEALTNSIKNLITSNLTLTKLLEKKKESFLSLQENKKIPRSLRIKCELTTSPSYSAHPSFLKLKEDLKQEVSTFITKGTKILTEWANIYIELLTVDRCRDIMTQALQILDCLTTFYVGAIGIPLWPSVDDQYLTLFLFKAYLSDNFCKLDEVSQFFNLSIKDILLIGTKQLTKSKTDEEATSILDSLKLSDIDMENNIDNFFLTEILINFDQILKVSTIGAWYLHTEQTKQMLAATNMKSKLKTLQTITASAATALALTKATENFDHQQKLDVTTNLRISNVERTLNKQEHKTNTILKHLRKPQQKNSQGSHSPESVTSPEVKTLSKKQNRNHTRKLKRGVVDLTTEESEEELRTEDLTPNITSSTKRTKQSQRRARGTTKIQPTQKKLKSIHWKNTETIQQFHPHYPVSSSFIQHTQTNPFTTQVLIPKPPLFPPPPPPQLSAHPFYAQNSFQPQNGSNYRGDSQIPQNQQLNANPFLNHTQTLNPFRLSGRNATAQTRKNPFHTQWNPFNNQS
jgi:hypothetical protein